MIGVISFSLSGEFVCISLSGSLICHCLSQCCGAAFLLLKECSGCYISIPHSGLFLCLSLSGKHRGVIYLFLGHGVLQLFTALLSRMRESPLFF